MKNLVNLKIKIETDTAILADYKIKISCFRLVRFLEILYQLVNNKYLGDYKDVQKDYFVSPSKNDLFPYNKV